MLENRILLRIPETAEALGLSRSRIYELIGDGTIPTIRIGRSIRVPRRALDEWVEQQLGRDDKES
jgi:excisionase family DNA binding protein